MTTLKNPGLTTLLAGIAALLFMVTSPAVFSATTADYQTIEWTELMPPEDLEALMNPPEYLSEIADGSLEDQINSQLQGAMTADDSRYQQALSSTQIVPEFDNRKVRIPAFIVPLEYDDDQRVTEFFLVPYFGACIHVPPPPPNQIIHASYDQGMTLEALYDAFWISGTLQTTMTENDTATSAYSIAVEAIEPYTE